MADFGSPAARRRLAAELRRLRKAAHMTGKDVALRAGWSEAKLSRIENGQARVKLEDLDELLQFYDVPASLRASLVALGHESHEAGPLEELEGDVPEGHARILELEAEARDIWTWEPQVVPGALQVEDYTRALLELWPRRFARPPAEIERRIETGRLRTAILSREPRVEMSFVIDESVLRRRIAPHDVMREQLNHLAAISGYSNVELRVLALGSRHVIGTGAFVYFRFPEIHGVSQPDTVALEHLHGTTFVESEADVNTYGVVFSALKESSLDSAASRELIARTASELWLRPHGAG
jgi:transcriptional regulator with XRE-family HTH domain